MLKIACLAFLALAACSGTHSTPALDADGGDPDHTPDAPKVMLANPVQPPAVTPDSDAGATDDATVPVEPDAAQTADAGQDAGADTAPPFDAGPPQLLCPGYTQWLIPHGHCLYLGHYGFLLPATTDHGTCGNGYASTCVEITAPDTTYDPRAFYISDQVPMGDPTYTVDYNGPCPHNPNCMIY